jgi:hypothetical protein
MFELITLVDSILRESRERAEIAQRHAFYYPEVFPRPKRTRTGRLRLRREAKRGR